MKVKLLRDVKPFGRTGKIVTVPPASADWLTALGMGVPAEEVGEQIETPEKALAVETAVKAPAKTAKAQTRRSVKKEK